MSDHALIVRDDSKLLVSYTKEAEAMRDDALAIAGAIGKVTNAEEQQIAVNAQAEIQRVRQLAEKARKAAKEPVLEFGRKIDSAAKDFVSELDAEMTRISQLVGSFQQLEQMKMRAAEQARQEELTRLERERAEALSKASSHEAADAINEHFCTKAAQLPVAESHRAEGQIVRQDWEISVKDIWTLARAHPTCVKIEPRISEIKELLKLGVKVQGITAELITKAGVRVSTQKAISV